ncbi:MAG: tyrosine-type recombinase/integrase [Erysipelotrichaceae bacterium]|nr:tyrosine-type recombinase/integrase [Erysipelotrichaceae bacterium]
MAVFKKNNKWYIKGKIKKDDGSYYQYTKLAQGCQLQKEAKEYERLFRMQYQDIQVSIRNKTFEEIAIEMNNDDINVKEATRHTNLEVLRRIFPKIGNKKINLITKDYLQRFIRELESKYSEAYVSAIYYAINKVFKYALLKDYIQINPLSKVRLRVDRDTVKAEKHFWEPADFERFIKEVQDIEYKAFYTFSFWMGTRRGETLALQWKDVDFNNKSVSIHKTVTKRIKNKDWALTTPKTKNSIRNITMPDVVVDILHTLYDKQKVMYGFNNEVFLFGYYRPMPEDYPRRYMEKLINEVNQDTKAKIDRITIHEFRHSHASYLINNMSDQFTVYDIAKRLGDTVETVLSTYAHQFKNADKKLSDFINKDVNKEQTTAQQAETKPNKYAELIELKKLLDMDVITEAEFETKKKQVLGI